MKKQKNLLKGGLRIMPKIRYGNREKIIEESKEFDEFIRKNNLLVDGSIVLLTKENVEIIESLIEEDPDYFPFSKFLFESFGTNKIKNNTERTLFAVAREIDRDNSTNVWRYKKNRDSFNNMIEYISNPNNLFFERLERGDISLPDEIVNQCGPGLKSLSSKICKYLCEFAFQKDNYYINDSFVRGLLLFYLDYYNIGHPGISSTHAVNTMSYIELHNLLQELHTARNKKYNDKITKSELDHIMWYCYKSFKL